MALGGEHYVKNAWHPSFEIAGQQLRKVRNKSP